MSETEVALPEIDSAELFRGAMDNAPSQEPATEPAEAKSEPTEQTTERAPHPTDANRYADGTFKPQAKEAEAAPIQQQAPEQPKDTEAFVPSWRVREYREDRDKANALAEERGRQAAAYEQQLAHMQRQLAELQRPKQEPVDFFADPNAAFKQQVAPIEERQAKFENDMRMMVSETRAIVLHGKEAVAEAKKAVEDAVRAKDPSIATLRAQLSSTDDPVGTAVQWHSMNKTVKETGGNLAAYKAKILEEAMKDPAFQAKAIEAARGAVSTKQTSPNIQLPPSLNKTAGSSGNANDVVGDLSSESLFRHAMSR